MLKMSFLLFKIVFSRLQLSRFGIYIVTVTCNILYFLNFTNFTVFLPFFAWGDAILVSNKWINFNIILTFKPRWRNRKDYKRCALSKEYLIDFIDFYETTTDNQDFQDFWLQNSHRNSFSRIMLSFDKSILLFYDLLINF